MRHRLGTLTAGVASAVLLTLTGGCGGSSSSTAHDPAGSRTSTPGPIDDATVLPLISATAAGGHGGTVARELDSRADVDSFAAQFRGPALGSRLRAVVEPRLGAGHQVVAQVVAIGCDRPPGVDVMRNPDGSISLVPHEVATPLQECLAAVTTVAVAIIPT